MTEPLTVASRWRRTALRNGIALLVLGAAVHLLVPQLAALKHALELLRSMAGWAVSGAVAAQILSNVANGYVLSAVARLLGGRLSLSRSMMISLASSSAGLLWGGQVTISGTTYKWMRDSGVPAPGALLGGWLPALILVCLLCLLSLFGMTHLFLRHDLPAGLVGAFAGAMGVLLALMIVLAWGLRRRAHLTALVARTRQWWSRMRRRPYDPAGAEASMERLFQAWDIVQKKGWRMLLLGSTVSLVGDLLTLYLLFVAVHQTVSIGVLISGYGVPLLIGRLSPIPGGIGLVEGTMAALYQALGVARPTAIVAILGYRLLSFWLRMLIGFPLIAWLGYVRDERGGDALSGSKNRAPRRTIVDLEEEPPNEGSGAAYYRSPTSADGRAADR